MLNPLVLIKQDKSMATRNIEKPNIVQQFDRFVDREYYKIVGGLIFTYEKLLRSDRLEEARVLKINCDRLPDQLIINGKEYHLTEVFEIKKPFKLKKEYGI